MDELRKRRRKQQERLDRLEREVESLRDSPPEDTEGASDAIPTPKPD